jgi:hypothetical protein
MSFRPDFLVNALLLVLLVLVAAVPAQAQLVPLGPPLRVSGGFNVCPEVFVAGDGGFRVAWKRAQDAFSFRCTQGFLEVASFDSEGRLSSSRVEVIAKTREACVEDFRILQPEGDGGATVVWEWKQGKFGFEGVSATEMGKGSYFNDMGGGWIRPLRTGGFVVIRQGSLANDDQVLVAERFEAPGDDESQRIVVTRTTSSLFQPDVAETTDGGLFFVWPEASDGGRLMGRRFDALGQPRGEAFEIARAVGFASVVSNVAGRVAVTWIGGAGGDRVQMRVYDEDGEPAGPEIEVGVRASPY